MILSILGEGWRAFFGFGILDFHLNLIHCGLSDSLAVSHCLTVTLNVTSALSVLVANDASFGSTNGILRRRKKWSF